jgi:hypothetical protein
MAKDYDKIAQSLGGANYDSLATNLGGTAQAPAEERVAVKAHTRKKRNPVVASLPAIGGVVGGILGSGAGGIIGTPADVALGPFGTLSGAAYGGAVGAGTLGAAGEGLAQMLSGEQASPMETAKAGATQAAFESGGRTLAAIPGAILSPASRAVTKFLSARSEDVVRTADQLGVHVNATEAVDKALAPLLKRAQAAGVDAVKRLEAFRENFLGNKAYFGPTPQAGATTQVMPATGAHDAKEYFDALAKGIYKNQNAGVRTPDDQLVGVAAKRLADQLRMQLRAAVPGYTEALAQESKNIGRRRALEFAAKPAAYVGAAAAMHETPGAKNLPWYVRYGVVPAVAGHFANPGMVGGMADLATNPMLQLWLQGTLANLGRAGAVATDQSQQE